LLVFVYGTLTESDQVDEVLDDWRFAGRATLEGLARVEGRYPTLAPGGTTDGRLLTTPEVDALDAYERVDDGLYVRASVPVDPPLSGHEEAVLYVGDPDRLDAPGTWPGEGPFPDRVRRVLADRDVVVRPE
jgi:gamma-glutamylcyclotransferase (GGCT)/AIG2-like uncharacterized protein YtfP